MALIASSLAQCSPISSFLKVLAFHSFLWPNNIPLYAYALIPFISSFIGQQHLDYFCFLVPDIGVMQTHVYEFLAWLEFPFFMGIYFGVQLVGLVGYSA